MARIVFFAFVLVLQCMSTSLAAGIRVPLDGGEFRVVQFDNLRTLLYVNASDLLPPELIITGPKEKAENIAVDQFGHVMVIRTAREEEDSADFRAIDPDTVATITMVVPTNVELALLNFSGYAEVGDINGRVSVRGGRSKITIGNVQELDVERWGSGYLAVGNVELIADVISKGSASVRVGNVAELRILHIGSGDVRIGDVSTSLFYNGAGSGNLTVEKLDGAGAIETNGSGMVRILSGTADPFFVTLNGEGTVRMDGRAVNPVLRHDKRGKIEIGTIVGLKQEGPAQAKFPLEWDDSLIEQ